jgi:hypothetical protein
MQRALLAIALLAAATSVQAEHRRDQNFERVLVPVFFAGPGAQGAQWATNVEVMNTGAPLQLAHPVLGDNEPGAEPDEVVCNGERNVGTRDGQVVCSGNQHAAGVILYVPRNANPQDVHISARVLDLSRTSDRYGTAIPVIWEGDLLSGTMVLLDIPTGDRRYRSGIRLFDVYQWNTVFTLRFYDMDKVRKGTATTPLLQTQVTAVWDFDSDASVRPMRPSFAQIGDLMAAFPVLASVDSVAIEITGANTVGPPDQPESRLYALGSITNNTTQEVTIVSPK